MYCLYLNPKHFKTLMNQDFRKVSCGLCNKITGDTFVPLIDGHQFLCRTCVENDSRIYRLYFTCTFSHDLTFNLHQVTAEHINTPTYCQNCNYIYTHNMCFLRVFYPIPISWRRTCIGCVHRNKMWIRTELRVKVEHLPNSTQNERFKDLRNNRGNLLHIMRYRQITHALKDMDIDGRLGMKDLADVIFSFMVDY